MDKIENWRANAFICAILASIHFGVLCGCDKISGKGVTEFINKANNATKVREVNAEGDIEDKSIVVLPLFFWLGYITAFPNWAEYIKKL